MKLRVTLVALMTMAATTLGGAAYASSVDPGNGSTDTSFYNHTLYDRGDPTTGSTDSDCRVRIAGPYPSSGKVVAKYRIECKDKSYLNYNDYTARLKNISAGYGAYSDTSKSRCTNLVATSRTAGDGSTWWGCNYTLTVTDQTPARADTWEATLADTDAVATTGGTVYYSSVVSWCANHQTWCNSHTGVPAIQYWVG